MGRLVVPKLDKYGRPRSDLIRYIETSAGISKVWNHERGVLGMIQIY